MKTSNSIHTVKCKVNEDLIISKISKTSIIGNVVLATFKMFAGITGKSSAMISDSIHSLSDVFTTIIAVIGVKISSKEADESHPYGHERLECVASLGLGLILCMTGLGIGKLGIENIISGDYTNIEIPGKIALLAAIVSIIIKEAMYWYTRYYAKILNSTTFMADAWHHRSDALSSIGALIGIGGSILGFTVLDSIASIVICIFILKVSYDILKDSINKMTDTPCDKEFEKSLREYIEKQKEVDCIDVLRSRKFGSKIYVDLEIQVDGNKSLREAHEIAENIHNEIEERFTDIKHVMIHLNPTE